MPFGVCRTQGSLDQLGRAAARRTSVNVAAGKRTGAHHQRVALPAMGLVSLLFTIST
jgi:hypothetical protein